MNIWGFLIIVLVFGSIVGSVLLLKHTAKMKFPTPKQNNNAKWDEED